MSIPDRLCRPGWSGGADALAVAVCAEYLLVVTPAGRTLLPPVQSLYHRGGVAWEASGVPRTLSGGHWFNAYVDEAGKVCWADEQLGVVADWLPQYPQDIWSIIATARQA